jgi:hypothetical protein
MKFGHISRDSRPHRHSQEPTNRNEKDEDCRQNLKFSSNLTVSVTKTKQFMQLKEEPAA